MSKQNSGCAIYMLPRLCRSLSLRTGCAWDMSDVRWCAFKQIDMWKCDTGDEHIVRERCHGLWYFFVVSGASVTIRTAKNRQDVLGDIFFFETCLFGIYVTIRGWLDGGWRWWWAVSCGPIMHRCGSICIKYRDWFEWVWVRRSLVWGKSMAETASQD